MPPLRLKPCSACKDIAMNDCVEAALEILRRHFAASSKAEIEKQEQINKLSLRNSKLQRIVDLLQKQQKEKPYDSSDEENATLNTAAFHSSEQLLALSGTEQSSGEAIEETEGVQTASYLARTKTAQSQSPKHGLRELYGINDNHKEIEAQKGPEQLPEKKLLCLSLRRKESNRHLMQTTSHLQENRKVLQGTTQPKSVLSWILDGRVSNLNTSSDFIMKNSCNDSLATLSSPHDDESVIVISPPRPEIINLDEIDTLPTIASKPKISLQLAKRVKKEKVEAILEQSYKPLHNLGINERQRQQTPSDLDDSDDFMPRPIKEEPFTPKRSVRIEHSKVSLSDAEKFKSDRQPESGKEIPAHQSPIPGTPADFWDPRILSFDENDPRNEVFVDKRFLNKNIMRSRSRIHKNV